MSATVFKCLPELKNLAKAKPRERRKLLQVANLMLIRSIVECVQNVLKGNIQLKKCSIDKLRTHKKILRKIRSQGNKLKQKKKIIIQHGGSFLPILLAPVIGVIAEKFFEKISKK